MALDLNETQRAVQHLRTADPVMRNLMKRAGPFTLKPRRDRFHTLVGSIISQQISGKAADSIRMRLKQRVAPERISAESLLRLSLEELRHVGVSPQKAKYLRSEERRVGKEGRSRGWTAAREKKARIE